MILAHSLLNKFQSLHHKGLLDLTSTLTLLFLTKIDFVRVCFVDIIESMEFALR